MSNQKRIFRLISELAGSDNKITADRTLCKFMGSLEGGVFLSQLLFWSDKGQDGTFYKSYVEWEEEIMLSEYQVRKFAGVCIERGFLTTELKKAKGAPTVHYTLSFQKFLDSILKFLGNQDSEKFKNPNPKNSETYKQKNTTEEYADELCNDDAPNGVDLCVQAQLDNPVSAAEQEASEVPIAEIERYWQRNIGKVNDAVGDALMDLRTLYGGDIVLEAVKEAIVNNSRPGKPTMGFVRAIAKSRYEADQLAAERRRIINSSYEPGSQRIQDGAVIGDERIVLDGGLASYRKKFLQQGEKNHADAG